MEMLQRGMLRMQWNNSLLAILSVFFLFTTVVGYHYECIPRTPNEAGIGVANCSAQKLTHVPPNLPHNIKVLDLSDNIIGVLSDNSFVKYEYLEILYMRNNSLRSIRSKAFARMRMLLYLDLSFNSLASISSTIFNDLTALLTLSLQGNRITVIEKHTFQNVSYLTNLFLAGNHIEIIEPEAFQGLHRLQRIELQNNALTKLDSQVVQYFSVNLKEIKLNNNRWYCDCALRWLPGWLINGSENQVHKLRWKFNGDEPVCHGPALVKNRLFSKVSLDLFVCPLTMYSVGRNFEVTEGGQARLFCKYMADPPVMAQWKKNGIDINIPENSYKYKTVSKGATMINNELHIFDFNYDDIGEYQCYVENLLGPAYISFLVTLEGVDPATIMLPDETKEEPDNGDKVRNAIIAASTIGGVVVLLIVAGIIVLSVLRCKRYRKKKKESIRMTFEEHLKANGIIDKSPKSDPMIYNEVPDSTMSMDAEMEEQESMYDSLQRPRIPSTNTNTYISFKTEFSEPEDMSQIYSSGKETNYKGSDESQCESTSPLLENISPIIIDPHDPFYQAHLYTPNLSSYAVDPSFLSSTRNHDFYLDNDNVFLNHGTRTLPLHQHNNDIFSNHRTRTLPHGYTPTYHKDFVGPQVFHSHSVSANHKSASVGNLEMAPPKKPPRAFHSRDTMSLHSQSSNGDRESLKLSLPKPGTVDSYGTAV